MSQEPLTVSYTLEDVLREFNQKLEKGLDKLNDKLDKQYEDLNQKIDKLAQKIDRQYEDLNQKIDKLDEKFETKFENLQNNVNDLKVGQVRLEEKLTGEIKTLDAKIDGLTKRLDFQEFINRGVIIGLLVTILGGFANLLGWIGNK